MAPNASHSCVQLSLDGHFAAAGEAVRAAFDRIVDAAQSGGEEPAVAVVAQRTRIVLAAPMRFLAVQVRRDRLVGHVFLERAVAHPVVTEVVPNAYGSGLVMHRFVVRGPDDVDEAFRAIVRESAQRVGRRERLASARR